VKYEQEQKIPLYLFYEQKHDTKCLGPDHLLYLTKSK